MKNDGKRTAGVEILAPAGSLEGLRAAIGAGADAVYMGGARFGARAYADNPEQDALCEAIDYVHLHGRRIYLTVNTLLKPEEMGDALYHYLKPFYEQGVDAVIVQDAGVLEFVAREFPGLPVHASTQMSLTMAKGAKCFAGYPVTRLVNARELGLLEIQRIREESTLEIESFVHGALCYCYSGQCLMSSLIGGRSGNRGRCAQPCRLEYDGTYLLSPKDICTLDMIPELIEAGIDSFKIEGRMKRYEYAAGVTAAYRREVDRYFSLGKEGYRKFHEKHPKVLMQALADMQDLYNRGGFTQGYYRGHNGRAMMSMARPNHSGVAVARVEQVVGNRALLCCERELYAQDVLEIRMGENMGDAAQCKAAGDKAGKRADAEKRKRRSAGEYVGKNADAWEKEQGNTNGWKKDAAGSGAGAKTAEKSYEFTLGQAHAAGERFEAKFMPGLPVKTGDMVYRTKNNRLLDKISEEYFAKDPKIRVSGEFKAKVGEPVELSVWVERENPAQRMAPDVICGVRCFGEVAQRAEKQPVSEERLRAALEKTGDTPFYFSPLEIRVSGEIFIPVSALNALRREALDAVAKEIAAGYRRGLPAQGRGEEGGLSRGELPQVQQPEKQPPPVQAEKPSKPEIHVSVMEKGQFEAVLKAADVRRIYYDLAALPVEDLPCATARAKRAGAEFFLRLPRICRAETYDFLQKEKDVLLGASVDGYLLQNYEELFLFAKEWRVQEMGKRLVADAMLYAMNAQAKQFFRGLGVAECTAPYEENAQELKELGIRDMALVVYGRLPLMTSAQCIYKNTKGCLGRGAGTDVPLPFFITDRKNEKLPVQNFCRFCYNVIYSPKCLSLLGCDEIRHLAPMALRYDFTLESGDEVLGILNGGSLPKTVEYTRGHFRRGVQ